MVTARMARAMWMSCMSGQPLLGLSSVVPAKAGTHTPQTIASPVAMGPGSRADALGRDDSGEGLPVQLARRLRLVVAERVERIGSMQEALDRRARDHRIR